MNASIDRPELAFSGPRMKRARLLAGLTRRQLAQILDVTEATIWGWETGDRLPSDPNILPRLAREIGVELAELYERSWPNEKP